MVHESEGNAEEAITSAENSLSRYVQLADHEKLIAFKVLLSCYNMLNDCQNAALVRVKALRLIRNLPNQQNQHDSLTTLFGTCLIARDYGNALIFAQAARENAILVGNKVLEGEILVRVGAVYLCQGKEVAEATISEGLFKLKHNGSPANLVEAYFVLAGTHELLNHPGRAIAACEEAARIAEESRRYGQLKMALEGLLYSVGKLNNAQSQLQYYESLLDRPQVQAGPPLALKAYSAKGMLTFSSGQLEAAVLNFQKAAELAREIRDPDSELVLIGSLGRSLEGWALEGPVGDETNSRLRSALESYKRQLELARQLDNVDGTATALMGLGRGHGSLGNLRQAISYFKQRLALDQKVRPADIGATVTNLATVYVEDQRPQEAVALFESCLSDSETRGYPAGVVFYLQGLGFTYQRLKKPHDAIAFYERAIEVAGRSGISDGEAASMYLKAQILAGDFKRYDEAITLGLAAVEKMKMAEVDPTVIALNQDEIDRWRRNSN